MGNEKSALSGIEIEEKALEVTDFWTHHNANVDGPNLQKISIFISEPSLHYTASFGKPSPLERIAKNLMLHRHPYILKYISSWNKGSKFFLATEEARPLLQVIETQSTLQICIGLHNILSAISFLHENALASHNNVCSNSIYVTPEGCWKLSGLEFLCRFKDLSPTYFQKIKSYRCERSISPEEDVSDIVSTGNFGAIDAYAFGVLAEDILKLKNASKDLNDVPALTEFREFCQTNLQNPDVSLRNKLVDVLNHAFFTHEFMRIHAFLEELPLKSENEKQEFFTYLVTHLKTFPEEIVAKQLSRLLLSRMVLLDSTAQVKLVPYVLTPKDEDNVGSNLFTVSTFKKYLVPKLLQMFCIRDASIRLLLLSHFKSFVHVFQTDDLKSHILPELLVGIKDTNDCLVSATLRALADVVPILGAATVIGGKRGKLFTDGRPNNVKEHKATDALIQSLSSTNDFVSINTDVAKLPERPSPDGGEDKQESKRMYAAEENTWSDWDVQETTTNSHCEVLLTEPDIQNIQTSSDSLVTAAESTFSSPLSTISKNVDSKYIKKSVICDISELDIKHSKSMKVTNDEIDFFTDMEPVIKKTQVLHVDEPSSSSKSMFDIKNNATTEEGEENDGWGEDLSDWGSDAQELKL